MKKENVILITMDAVRPDRLSCYGYNKIETKGIDTIAKEGTLFKNCISTSCFTPVSVASILSGKNPDKTKVRDPFDVVKTKIISEILKEHNYKTAGFISVSLLDSKHKFNAGFDYFDEALEEESFHTSYHERGEQKIKDLWGSWWIDRMFNWLKEHAADTFFIWGHYLHVHFLAEKQLLYSGKLNPDELFDYAYYDAKVKYMDEQLFQPLIKILKDLDIWNNTTIVITSDHGEILGPKNPTWKDFYLNFPTHRTMYDSDLKVPLIIKNKNLESKIVDEMVRSIDIVPTIIDLLDIPVNEKFDGVSLISLIKGRNFPELTAYSEDLFGTRGNKGDLQAVRTCKYKLIRNITKNQEEFYNIQKDPEEKINIIDTSDPEEIEIIKKFRTIMDKTIKETKTTSDFHGGEKQKIKERLRALGYIT